MKRLSMVALIGLLALPAGAMAQTPQVTNADLLQLIGIHQIQNLQCSKALEAAQLEVAKLKPVDKPKEASK